MILGAACSTPRWASLPRDDQGRIVPGSIVPLSVPFQRVADERAAAMRDLGGDHAALVSSGWLSYVDCPFPLSESLRDAADRFLRMDAEYSSRRAAQYGQQPGDWRPWTADPICAPCKSWVGKGGTQSQGRGSEYAYARGSGWSWKGVRSLPIGTSDDYRHVITCGMLRDAGIITDSFGCEAENVEAQAAYNAYHQAIAEHDARVAIRHAQQDAIAITVVTTVVSMGAGAAVGAAYGAAAGVAAAAAVNVAQATASALKDGKISAKEALSIVGSAARAIPGAGIVIEAAVKTIVIGMTLVETIEARKDAKKALRDQASRIQQLQQLLANLIEQRAELAQIREATAALRAEIAATKQEAGGSSRLLLAAAAVFGLMLLRGRR